MEKKRTWRQRYRTPIHVSIHFVLALCGALGYANPARAVDAQKVQQLLRVRPGATCLNAKRIARVVEQWLKDEEISTDVIFVIKGSDTDPYAADMHVVREGQPVEYRSFKPGPTSCDYLHAAIGLAIALTFKAPLEDEPAQPSPDEIATHSHDWSLSLAGLGTYQVLSGWAAGLDIAVHRTLGPIVALRFGALGIGAFDSELKREMGRFDALLVAARTDACARVMLTTSLLAQVCAGVIGGGLFIRGTSDFMNPLRDVVYWFALASEAGMEFELSRHWSLTVDFSPTFLLHRVIISTEDSRGTVVEAQSLPRVGFILGIGPKYSF